MSSPATKAPKAKALDAIDLQLLEARFRNPEASQQALADALGMTLRTVNRRVNKPEFKAELYARYAQAAEDVVRIARANASKVMKKLVKIVDSTTAEDRDIINAAREIISKAVDPKLTIAFDQDKPLKVSQAPPDLSKLNVDELRELERLLIAAGAAAPEGQGA